MPLDPIHSKNHQEYFKPIVTNWKKSHFFGSSKKIKIYQNKNDLQIQIITKNFFERVKKTLGLRQKETSFSENLGEVPLTKSERKNIKNSIKSLNLKGMKQEVLLKKIKTIVNENKLCSEALQTPKTFQPPPPKIFQDPGVRDIPKPKPSPTNLPKINFTKKTFEGIKLLITKDQTLPGSSGGTKMTGEEHIHAILYQNLRDRKDCVLLMKPASKDALPENFHSASLNDEIRYLLIPLSVNSNTHNTALAIDRENKTYTYFDSLGGKISKNLLKECKEKGLDLDAEYKEEIRPQTHQKDGWSCGFHVIENLIAYVNNKTPSNLGIEGNTLREKYKPDFENFAITHGLGNDNQDQNRLNRRYKRALRDAIEMVVNRDKTHPLYRLYQALAEELFPDSDFSEDSLQNFLRRYESKNPDDALAAKILNDAMDASGNIYRELPKSIDKNPNELRISEVIKNLIETK